MYDYIKITSNGAGMSIDIAYAEPQDNARKVEYIRENEYGRYSKVSAMTTGEVKTELITAQEFAFKMGYYMGEISKSLPTNEE